jgi:hypothetical protein
LKKGDAESDADSKGNGFFVDEYADNTKAPCSILIRIGADKGYTNRARFIVSDGAKLPHYCKDKPESESLFLQK